MKTYVIPGNLDDIFANTNPAVQVAKALKGLGGIEVYPTIAIKVDTPEDEMMVERALILSEAQYEVILPVAMPAPIEQANEFNRKQHENPSVDAKSDSDRTRYLIIDGTNFYNFQQRVSKTLAEGWELAGPLVVESDRYYQALTRD